MSNKQQVQIVWFKRDLRVSDHAPLWAASQSGVPVLPLYIVEPDMWAQPDFARRHWHFVHDCLISLNNRLQALGQPLVIRQGQAVEVMADLTHHYDVISVYAHEETGNAWSFERDKAVIDFFESADIPFIEYPSNGVVRRLKTRDAWASIRNNRMAESIIPAPPNLTPVLDIKSEALPSKDDALFGSPLKGIVQTGGRKEALQTLKSFLYERCAQYVYTLSAPGPSEIYCSRLSTHLTWGTLSSREVIHEIERRLNELPTDDKKWKRNLSAFSARIAWRCHFIQKLEQQPSIEFMCMHEGFENMRDNFNEEYFTAWKEGRTGYPIIDACMRQLTHDGWITFRMRAMLVSFASYHLWLDWRKTAHHLATLFTDYEPGIHYSQMQMQSGVTGINTLRIYNPIKQSEDHDPYGAFIKKWLPALKDVPDAFIHAPWEMTALEQQEAGCIIGEDYPTPIVDHKTAVAFARAEIAKVQKGEGVREVSKKVFNKLGSRNRPPSQTRRRASKRNIIKKQEPSNQLSFLD